jgi:hypothetical protein
MTGLLLDPNTAWLSVPYTPTPTTGEIQLSSLLKFSPSVVL